MRIDIVSIFPEVFEPVFGVGMLRLAQDRGLLEIHRHDLRDFTTDKHRQVDDEPYGGGPGMVMKPEPFFRALSDLLGGSPFVVPGGSRTILLTPQGDRLSQPLVEGLAKAERLVILCGRYEGVDARVAGCVTDEVSIGDYVLSGGEIGAMVLVDAVGRLISGVLGDEESLAEESFTGGFLEYPQYTRPATWKGLEVPEVLLSGNHGSIRDWRREKSEFATKVRRPDLYRSYRGARTPPAG
jgi:tRNA (guanine37-N1)-methyltransferase